MDLPRVDVDDPTVRLAGDVSDRTHSSDPGVVLDPRLLSDVAEHRRRPSRRHVPDVLSAGLYALVATTPGTAS